MFGYGALLWLLLIQLCSCSPLITSPNGFVIEANSHRVAVVHFDAKNNNKGVVRYYEFPCGHNYKKGDCYGCEKYH